MVSCLLVQCMRVQHQNMCFVCWMLAVCVSSLSVESVCMSRVPNLYDAYMSFVSYIYLGFRAVCIAGTYDA